MDSIHFIFGYSIFWDFMVAHDILLLVRRRRIMVQKIKIGIVGYGNLGKGVELAISHNPDMELVAVFSRRDPKSIRLANPNTKSVHISEVESYRDKIDVMILCGGSATDLPE